MNRGDRRYEVIASVGDLDREVPEVVLCHLVCRQPTGANDDTRAFPLAIHAPQLSAAWQTTKTCENASGPNECKVSQQWSCLQALREIGPGGSTLPGLVEPK